MTNFEKCGKWDWEIGTHGLWIEWYQHSGSGSSSGRSGGGSGNSGHRQRKTATYLPEIAHEQGWSKRQTLASLLKKGGYHGRLEDIEDDLAVTRYQSSKVVAEYQEWIEFRNGNGGG